MVFGNLVETFYMFRFSSTEYEKLLSGTKLQTVYDYDIPKKRNSHLFLLLLVYQMPTFLKHDSSVTIAWCVNHPEALMFDAENRRFSSEETYFNSH